LKGIAKIPSSSLNKIKIECENNFFYPLLTKLATELARLKRKIVLQVRCQSLTTPKSQTNMSIDE